ncbi:MAG: hypothetical protein ACHQET_13310 [Chitinophagales bacterium]
MKRYVNTLVLIIEIACICFLHAVKIKESAKTAESIPHSLAKFQSNKTANPAPGSYILLKVK